MSIATFRNRFSFRQPTLSILMLAAVLAGCGEEEDPAPASGASQTSTATGTSTAATTPSSGSPTTGTTATTPPSGTVAPPTATPGGTVQNRAPTISGTPVGSINAGSSYTFAPTAADADGDTLAFTIANKPSWASFNTATGRLTGTPTVAQVGNYPNITVSVSDGKAARSLAAFAIAVNQISNGSASLSWTPPTENTDGSQLTTLSGYRIQYGTSPGALNQTITITNASINNYVVENLSPATWYFAVKAIANGLESDLSNVANKTIL